MSATSAGPCTASDLDRRGAVRLPVLATGHGPRGTVRRSQSGRRRAAVLIAVQLAMIAHIVVWLLSRKYGWWGGRSTTPVEPSESMEFVKHGVINAGLIFFVLALVSTLIFGRWFCGWGCHVVMLQDGCGWLMKKLGVRPKPFRSRLLIYVPLILALYMFVWPAFYRLAIAPWVQPDLEWPGFSVHLTTTEFYQTFPGVLVAIPFLLICGFATVYFLGAKGFCTYGCPYGGFFAPLDEFAVGRIRVTDACEQCGHCTAVCTSNVRVHEEVREYGMVVDPGCMKCLDCVSVCPNDALYFGFGRPAQQKGPPRAAAPKRVYDLTWPEEIGLALFFGLVFVSVRGVYNLIPLLMAAGIAGVVTFVAWKLWRLAREPEVRFHQFQLRSRGRLRGPGLVFATLAVAVVLLSVHCGLVNAAEAAGAWYDRQVTVPAEAVLVPDAPPISAQTRRAVDRGIWFYRAGSRIADGGLGLAGNAEIDIRLAWLYSCRRQFADAERLLRRVLERAGPTEQLVRDLARVLRAQNRRDEATAYYESMLLEHRDFTPLLQDLVLWSRADGRFEEAIRICRQRAEKWPNDLPTRRALALLLIDSGNEQEGLALMQKVLEAEGTQ